MTLATLEREIAKELAEEAGNKTIKAKDILEWCTGEIKPENETEKTIKLKKMGVYVTFKKELWKTPIQS